MEWISVNDRLPEIDEDVLISNIKDKWVSVGYLNHGEKEIWYDSFDDSKCFIYPTHWMPLPEPPKK